jgi:PAS domain S-box-containing protein
MPELRDPGLIVAHRAQEPLAVLLLGGDDRIVGACGDLVDLTGLDAKDLVGQPLANVLTHSGIQLRAGPVDGHLRDEQHGISLWSDPVCGDARIRAVFVARLPGSGLLCPTPNIDRFMLSQLPAGTWTTDTRLQITYAIGQLERNIGLSAERAVGMNVSDIARTNEPTDPVIVMHEAALHGERSSITYNLHDRWYDVTVDALRAADGKIVGTIGTAIDVTRRVRADHDATARTSELVRSLQRTVSLLEATIESTEDGLLVVDRGGTITAYNQRFSEMWRIPRAIIERHNDWELLAYVTDQLLDGNAFLDRVRALYGHPDSESLDKLRFKDGRIFERYSRPQVSSGDVVGRVWSFRDITERERTLMHARFLAEASRMLGSLELVPALQTVARLAVIDMADACAIDLRRNGDMLRVASVSRDPTITVPDALPPAVAGGARQVSESADRAQLAIPFVATRTGIIVGALTVTMKATTVPPYESEIFDELSRRCTHAVENDELHRYREDEIRAREEFLAVASHEFRGPLTAISLAISAYRNQLAPTTKLVDTIEHEVRAMMQIVDDLLDVSRLRTAPPQFQLTCVDLVAAAKSVASRFDRELARSHSTLMVDAPVPVKGTWDRARIEQVIAILLSNAIKFGNGRPIEIAVTEDGSHARLAVADHGIGIPCGVQETIFEPFARAAPSRQYGGLGLGLYIARQIVLAHGGRLDVSSSETAGTSFRVTLPRRPSPEL